MMVRDSLFDAMAQLLRRRRRGDVEQVIAVDTDRRTRGADSDEYTEVIVWIWYRTSLREIRTYEFVGDFGALLRELTD